MRPRLPAKAPKKSQQRSRHAGPENIKAHYAFVNYRSTVR